MWNVSMHVMKNGYGNLHEKSAYMQAKPMQPFIRCVIDNMFTVCFLNKRFINLTTVFYLKINSRALLGTPPICALVWVVFPAGLAYS